MPPPRYTVHHHVTGRWYIYDRLFGRRLSVAASMSSAERLARDYEAAWRGACERWQREEYWGD